MREIRTSGSMSGERKRSDGHMAPSNRASPRLYPYVLGERDQYNPAFSVTFGAPSRVAAIAERAALCISELSLPSVTS